MKYLLCKIGPYLTILDFVCGLLIISASSFAQPKTVNSAPPRGLTEAEQIMRKAKTGKPFDIRRNCLGDENFFSYRGQELYVFPYNQSNYYMCFKEPHITGDNPDYYNIQYYHWEDQTHYGTEAKYVVGRTFVVDRIKQCSDDAHEFVFEMHDKKTQERVSYEYSTATDWHRAPKYNPADPDFPFLVMSHYNYLKKKYIGKQLVVACQKYSEKSEYEHHVYTRESNGEFKNANLSGIYSTFNVADIIMDENRGMLCFLLTDNNGNQYFTPIEATYNEPEYSLGIGKKFLVQDWKIFVSKYGQEKMTNVMRGDIYIGMDSVLVRLSAGNPNEIRFARRTDGWEWLYLYKDVMVVYDENGKVKDIVEGVPSEEAAAEAAVVLVGIGAWSFGAMAWRFISFPFRLVGRLFSFLGL